MSDEQIVRYVRSRTSAEPPPDLVGRIMAAVDTAPSSRSSFAAFLPAAAVASAAAIVAAVAILIGSGPRIGPPPSPSVSAPSAAASTSSPSPASAAELRETLRTGIEALRAAPGVDGVRLSETRGLLGSATWFSWRPGGEQVVVTRTDLDVVETGWWMDPDGAPLAIGERIRTTADVITDAAWYRYDGDGWTRGARADAPESISFGTLMLDREVDTFLDLALGDLEGAIAVHLDVDGGETWTVVAPYRDGTSFTEWHLDPDGVLRSWVNELAGVSPTPDDAPFVTETGIQFAPLEDPPPIPPPDMGSPPDPEAFGAPADFPLDPIASPEQSAVPEPSASGDPTGSPITNEPECRHSSGAYSVTLPDGWWSNVEFDHAERGHVDACRLLGPAEFDPRSATREGVAIGMGFIDGGCTGHFTEILSEQETTVDGYPARVREYGRRKEGGGPPGTYEYVVTVEAGDPECTDRLITAVTWFDATGNYEENMATLDRIMASLRITPS